MDASYKFENEQDVSPLQVVVLYEDIDTGRRAQSLLNRLSNGVDNGLGLIMTLWRFDVLSLPAAVEQAAVEAAAADVVILSAKLKSKLSSADWEWMNRWLNHKEDRPYLFCLMLDPEWDMENAPNPLVAQLRAFTDMAGVSFVCVAPEAASATSAPFSNLDGRANHLSSVLEQILNQNLHHPGHRSWSDQH